MIRFTHDTYYVLRDKSIILKTSKIKCLSTSYTPCTLHFLMEADLSAETSFQMQNSTIQGKQVIVQGQNSTLTIDEESQITTDGQSIGMFGTNKKGGYGANFIA